MNHSLLTIVIANLIFVVTIVLFMTFSYGFLPSEDIGQIFGFSEAAQGISFESMKQHQLAVAEVVRQDPNVDSLYSTAGAGGPSPTGNLGRIMISLRPRSECKLNADEVIQVLRVKLAKIPGIQVFLQNPPPIRIGGQLTKSLYQFTLQSPEFKELYEVFNDPLYRTPLVLSTNIVAQPQSIFCLYLDRWPIEQIPLAAKQMLGLHRQFVSAEASCLRLPALALLAGNILTFLAAALPALPTGFWDRQPKKTPGRLRRLLAQTDSSKEYACAGQLRKKESVTGHLPKGVQAHRRHKAILLPI